MRIGNWKQSHTNRAIYPLDPRVGDVDVQDIAHALSLENRYGGHSPFPMSVAQHSVFVSRRVEQLAHEKGCGYEDRRQLALAGLLHDAHEAYLKDIPSPLKVHLRIGVDEMSRRADMTYKSLEAEWDKVIAEALSVAIGFDHPMVKQADAELLSTEATRFFPAHLRPSPWHQMPAPLDLGLELVEWHWTTAKEQFLRRYYELGDMPF